MSDVITAGPSPGIVTIADLARDPSIEIDITSEGRPPQNTSYWFYAKLAMLVLFFAVIGLNLFSILGNATDFVAVRLAPLFRWLGFELGNTIKGTANTAAEGSKLAIDVAAGTITTATDLLQGHPQKLPSTTVSQKANNTLDRMNLQGKAQSQIRFQAPPSADETTSTTQRGSSRKKGGYCYIGEDNGVRSCMRVSDKSMCMSGDIFPSSDVCVNPSLRP